MEPANEAAFALNSWQSALEKLKTFAKERVSELKGRHTGEDESVAKILEMLEAI